MRRKTYYMQHEDELLHFLWLRTEITGVMVDIFVDDGGKYKIDKHPLIAFVRNGYGREVGEFIAVAVEGKQEILSVEMDLKVTDKDFMAAKLFIRENQKLLKDFADSKVEHLDFFNQIVAFDDELWTDESGGVYSADRKQLLRVPNVKRFRISEGCEETDEGAFEGCKVLGSLYVPESYCVQAAEDTFNNMPFTVGNFCQWDRPYVEEVYDVNDYWYDEEQTVTDELGVMYANEGRRLIRSTRSELIGKEYVVPDGVLTICDGAFGFCGDYLELSVPRSIKVIGDYIFGEAGGKIVVRD